MKRGAKAGGYWSLVALAAVIIAATLTACGEERVAAESAVSVSSEVISSPSGSSEASHPDAENPTAEHTTWGAKKEIASVWVSVERPVKDTPASRKLGDRTIMVTHVTVENVNEESKEFDTHMFYAFDQRGRTYKPTHTTSKCRLSSGRLAAGESVNGWLAFDLPRGAEVKGIVWSWPVFEWVNEWTWE